MNIRLLYTLNNKCKSFEFGLPEGVTVEGVGLIDALHVKKVLNKVSGRDISSLSNPSYFRLKYRELRGFGSSNIGRLSSQVNAEYVKLPLVFRVAPSIKSDDVNFEDDGLTDFDKSVKKFNDETKNLLKSYFNDSGSVNLEDVVGREAIYGLIDRVREVDDYFDEMEEQDSSASLGDDLSFIYDELSERVKGYLVDRKDISIVIGKKFELNSLKNQLDGLLDDFTHYFGSEAVLF